ncbi:hypothetical protein GEMRC1_006934 [Eukaryota sp. GEM-RC1]
MRYRCEFEHLGETRFFTTIAPPESSVAHLLKLASVDYSDLFNQNIIFNSLRTPGGFLVHPKHLASEAIEKMRLSNCHLRIHPHFLRKNELVPLPLPLSPSLLQILSFNLYHMK